MRIGRADRLAGDESESESSTTNAPIMTQAGLCGKRHAASGGDAWFTT
jgi:hypothetical protein